METFFAGWLTVVVVGGFAVLSPGPNFAVTLKNSLAHSRRAGIWTAAGVAAGSLTHVAFSLLGLAAVVSRSVPLFEALKWFGAAYLVYIGCRSLAAKGYDAKGEEVVRREPEDRLRVARVGFAVSVLNPKAALFYLVLFTQVIEPETSLPARGVYGLTVVALAFGWYALVALFASQAAVKERFETAAPWVERIIGAVLVALGLRLVFT